MDNPTDIVVPARLKGRVVFPKDERYDAARLVDNAAIDRRPAAIVMAQDAEDIVATLQLVNDSVLPFAVRAGGHSVVGYGSADGGIVLNVSGMRDLEVDEASGTAWVGAGWTAGELTTTLHPMGYAVPFGDTGAVGVAGITLGGGIGWLVRRFGLTIDSLLEAELITAAGDRQMASSRENTDLFWALRGGGGNFGVVTRFRFKPHPVDTVLSGEFILPATPDLLRRFVDTLVEAPDSLTVISNIMPAPSLPAIPEAWRGKLVISLSFVHSGPIADDARPLDLLRSLGPAIEESVMRKPYPALFPPPSGNRQAYAHRTMFVDSFDDRAIEIIQRRMAKPSSPAVAVNVRVLGGAVEQVANDATAFAHRNRRALIGLYTPYTDLLEAARHEAWTADFEAELIAAGSGSGAYLSFLGTEGETALNAAYPPATLARLAEVKRRYDPDNLFRSNLNVKPRPPTCQ